MSRDDFLRELKSRIAHLPKEERDAAVAYYVEYFEEAGDDEAAWAALGSPEEAAARIIEDYNQRMNSMPVPRRDGTAKGCLLGVLATLGLPIWLPLLFVGVILALVFVFVLFILFVVLFVVAGALLSTAFKILFIHLPTALFSLGAAALLLGLGLLLVLGAVYGINYLLRKNRERKGEQHHE